jgi:hypothetical protein
MRPIMPRSIVPRSVTQRLFAPVACAALLAAAGPAVASQPVRKAQIGCVMMTGEFFNQDGYRLSPTGRDGAPVDLSPYRQKQLSLDGWLNPGDRYTLAAPPRVLGRCPIGR